MEMCTGTGTDGTRNVAGGGRLLWKNSFGLMVKGHNFTGMRYSRREISFTAFYLEFQFFVFLAGRSHVKSHN